MIADFDDDTHFCLKCHATVIGLDNYVDHRKNKCGKPLSTVEGVPISTVEDIPMSTDETIPKSNLQLIPPDEPFTLKADDFFSRLELQSSSKKTAHPTTGGKTISGIWTRSKTSAITQAHPSKEPEPSKSGKNAWIGGHQLKELGTGDNQTRLIKAVDNLSRCSTIKKDEVSNIEVYEDSEEDSDDYEYDDDDYEDDDDAPPRSHTGGKWKPTSPVNWMRPSSSNDTRDWNIPPPHFTGGKWKPSAGKTRNTHSPPPSHTKGKWKPASPSSSKESCDFPPPTFTGSKWTPSKTLRHDYEDVPPPNHTKGKWKPLMLLEKPDDSPSDRWLTIPPPDHTKGKWKAPSPTRKDDDLSIRGESVNRHSSTLSIRVGESTKWRDGELAKDDQSSKWRFIDSNKWKDEESSRWKGDDAGKWKNYETTKWKDESTKWKSDETTKWKGDESTSGNESPKGREHESAKWKEHESTKWKEHESTKWKDASQDSKEEDAPSPSYTKGKWRPTGGKDLSLLNETMQNKPSSSYRLIDGETPPFRKSSGTVQYWCGPCNRRLASKIVYERHLKSELHYKRTLHDREFDDSSNLNTNLTEETKRTPRKPVEYWSHTNKGDNKDTMKNAKGTTSTRRIRRKIYVKCEVCRSRVNAHLMGKHLISHYHCRRGDITQPEARKMVLENIHSIVLQSPFQCSICRFYCNTQQTFLTHWTSIPHIEKASATAGYFWCTFCKFKGHTSEEMLDHLVSYEHKEVISAFNRSVPIIIKKIRPIQCNSCQCRFTLNIQLRKHCERENHPYSDTSSDVYQSKFSCQRCGLVFKTKIALSRHQRIVHKDNIFLCSICGVTFRTIIDAKMHRRTTQHRYAVQEKQKREGALDTSKRCQYCDLSLENIPKLKEHLKTEHPEHSYSCPHCGELFTMGQEVTAHVKLKSCTFQQKHSDKGCDQCPFTSDSTSELLYHKVLHGEPLLIHPTEKQGPSSSSSNTSSGNRRPIQHFKCPICEKLYEKSSLRCHIRLHTRERPFVCAICGAGFVRKNNWMFHMKCHEKKMDTRTEKRKTSAEEKVTVLGDRPYLCSTCGASFQKKSTLHQHMTRHTGKLFRCPEEGCIFSARNRGELKIHLATHSDARPYACELCNYRSKTKSQLVKHATIHDNSRKKLQCPKCSFTCAMAAHLKRHMRLHTGAKPYSCPHCTYKCNNMENLRKHVLSTNKHPGKCIYECKLCKRSQFRSNFAKDFKVHLVTDHTDMFESGKEAMTYIAGIYDSMCDLTTVDTTPKRDRLAEEDISSNVAMMSDSPPVPIKPLVLVPSKSKDELLSTMAIQKEVCLENAGESWSMVGSYDVEESGVLVPFHPDRDSLFHEPF